VGFVNEKHPFSKPKPIMFHAVIEPMIYKFIFSIPITKLQVFPAMIGYKITLFDMIGKILFTKVVDGIGDTRGHPDFNYSKNPTRMGFRGNPSRKRSTNHFSISKRNF
jgi:hypothetical protein